MSISDFPLTAQQKADYEHDGFLIVSGLFSTDEVQEIADHFMAVHQAGLDPESAVHQHYRPVSLEETEGEILRHYPRIMQPARWDEASLRYLLDSRVGAVLEQLLEDEPLAAQSMLYFKPPGARGQALHQDNFYLGVKPGNCMAAWLSLDRADAENGGMFVVPGSHNLPVLCPHLADMTRSFAYEEVTVPEGLTPVQITLEAGDVLFFNGSVIHGSTPNSSSDRFRRAFICHYVPDSTKAMSHWYYPLVRFNGETLTREENNIGTSVCGTEDRESYEAAQRAFQENNPVLAAVH